MSLCSCQRCAQLLRSCISNNNPLCKQPLGETTCPAVMDEAGRAPPKLSRTLFKLHDTARTPSSLLLLDPQPAPSQVCFSWVLSASFDYSRLPTQAFSVWTPEAPPASPLPPQKASSTLLAFLIPTCWEFSNSYLFSRLSLWAQMPTWHLCLDTVQVKAQRDPKMQCLNRGVAPSQIIAGLTDVLPPSARVSQLWVQGGHFHPTTTSTSQPAGRGRGWGEHRWIPLKGVTSEVVHITSAGQKLDLWTHPGARNTGKQFL